MAADAGRGAGALGVEARELDLVLVATSTADENHPQRRPLSRRAHLGRWVLEWTAPTPGHARPVRYASVIPTV
jgi:hypothetical protein